MVKNLPARAGNTKDSGFIPGLGRSPGEGNGNPLQYSCLENLMDRGAWRATHHRATQRVRHDWVTEHIFYNCGGLSHLILVTIQWAKYYFYFHLSDKMKPHRVRNLFCVTKLVLGRTKQGLTGYRICTPNQVLSHPYARLWDSPWSLQCTSPPTTIWFILQNWKVLLQDTCTLEVSSTEPSLSVSPPFVLS